METERLVADRAIPLLQTLVRNACVNTGAEDSGEETRSIEAIRGFLSEFDIESSIVYARPDRANLVARIPGRDPLQPTLAFMGHVDVVPADASQWSRDPFGGEVVDGEVWGRGTLDMLGMVATSVAAFTAIAEGEPPPGDVLLIVVSDEEAGGTFGARFLTEQHPDLVKCDYMVTEVGGMYLADGRIPGLTLTVGEKGICWARMRFHGTPGHGSMPYRSDNALVKASKAAEALSEYQPKPELTPIIRDMADAFMSDRLSRLLGRLPGTFDLALSRLYKRNPGQAKFLHTAARTSISPNVLTTRGKVNIVPGSAELEVDIRLLPGQGVEHAQRMLREAIGDSNEEVDIEFFEFYPSTVSELETPLKRATERILADVLPNTRIVPMFIGGVTDGRYWRQRGTVVYGFAANTSELTMDRFSAMIHGTDERIPVSCLERNLEYLTRLPYELGSEAAGHVGDRASAPVHAE